MPLARESHLLGMQPRNASVCLCGWTSGPEVVSSARCNGHQGAENLTSGFPPEHVLCARENLAHLASPKMLTQENQAVFQPWRVYS